MVVCIQYLPPWNISVNILLIVHSVHNSRVQDTCLCLLLFVFKPSDEWSRDCAAQLPPCSYSQNFNFDGPGDRIWVTYEAWGCLQSVAQHVLLFQVDFQVQRTTYLKCRFENTTHPLDYYFFFNLFPLCSSVVSCQEQPQFGLVFDLPLCREPRALLGFWSSAWHKSKHWACLRVR